MVERKEASKEGREGTKFRFLVVTIKVLSFPTL